MGEDIKLSGPDLTAEGVAIDQLTDQSPVRKDAKPIRSHVAHRGYTDIDKETVSLDLARKVLRSDVTELVDLRGQRRVGADAVDELERFYELKVYEGPEPDPIRLEPSQIKRVPLYNRVLPGRRIECGRRPGNPKVRIVTDPLNQLERVETRAVIFSGVRSAVSLGYELAPAGDEDQGDVRRRRAI